MTDILTIINSVLIFIVLTMFISLLINAIQKKINLFGQPPIHRILFVMGKTANFSCWFIFIYNLIKSFFIHYKPTIILVTLSTITLLISTIFIVASFNHLGVLNKFGLPSDKTKIIKKGIYSYSRNPMYLGFYFLNVSSIFYHPHLINIFLGVLGIIIHHLITLGEEKYMLQVFGNNWLDYKEKVRRYI